MLLLESDASGAPQPSKPTRVVAPRPGPCRHAGALPAPGLTPVDCACGVNGLWEPNPNHEMALDNLKKRCEMFASLGLTHIYAPVATTQKFKEDDYKTGADNMRKVGEVAQQFKMIAMFEFALAV